ncbi:DUF3156 family protein [Saccharothrix violaceirubra]|uniref:HSP18 transcriptional regulator n=1 Tax=Saccharothrix violaceirubra TaxID=413306 RepID=A0A7W7WWS6_9PSEU|nr:HSP18 transcriptional regulator [Saccharothrix violaceirubra]MBB4965898.1 hypothetical protein [Saccharothrix violaceirubra]
MDTGAYGSIRAIVADGVDGKASTAELLTALIVLRGLREELAAWEPMLIESARTAGASWAELAPALGVASRQAAERRYLRVRAVGAAGTAEQRVRAERDRRAGDRAVASWARDNAADLRGLAGRVGSVDVVVRQALADDDTALLVEPLLAALDTVRAVDPVLAEAIQGVGDRTDAVRRQTQADRDARD